MTDFKKLFSEYGEPVSFEINGETITVKALLRPLHHKNKTYFMPKRLPQGVLDNRHYLLLAPADFSAEPPQILTCNGRNYMILSREGYRVKGRTMYVWAVLTACTDSAEDDYDSD